MEGYAVNSKGKTEKNKKIKTGPCIFPYKYKGAIYNACLDTPKGSICATELNPKNGIMTKYGYCNDNRKKGTEKKAPQRKTLKKKSSSPKRKTIKVKRRKTVPKALAEQQPSLAEQQPSLAANISLKPFSETTTTMQEPQQRWNEDFIKVLEELTNITQRQGEPFKARAYQTAQETIMAYDGDIYNLEQISKLPGIGKTITAKLAEYMQTGTIAFLERERKNPVNVLTKVYGIGPKKADELVKAGITSITELRAHPELINDVQRIGLKYFEAIETRIPRSEIDTYKQVLGAIFQKTTPAGSIMEIVGSYRRGAQTSGDIDIILTNKDNNNILKPFMDGLIQNKILIEILSRGKTKSLTIARLPEQAPEQAPMQPVARRIDFLYTPPSEYPFALLYFTGSKAFNTVQRHRALTLGYSLSEHGLLKGVKGEKILGDFKTEKDIFDILGMVYKEPHERVDGRAVQTQAQQTQAQQTQAQQTQAQQTPTPAPPSYKKTGKKITLKIKPKTTLDKLNEIELSERIKKANEAYYCNKNPIMTDNEYDILVAYMLARFPANKVALEGHTQCLLPEKNKVKLPYEMWSMDKIKPDTAVLEKWKQTYKGPYVLSCKLDGVSGLYSTEGAQPKLYTRGNGLIGQDISHFLPYLNLPKTQDITLRGEFIIKKELFKTKYARDFANPRNFVAGIINQKIPDPAKCADLSFVTYEVLKPILKPSAQMEYLQAYAIGSAYAIVEHIKSATVSTQILSELLKKWRAEYAYEIDGIICINDAIYKRQTGNPAHAFAFKMLLSDQVVEAKVLSVIWTPSKDGYLKPRVQIEPVQLGGVKIEYATGFNAKFIEENQIGVGAIVQLVRSGDVIPHIIAVLKPALESQMPLVPYEWNATHVDIMLHNKADDATVKEKNITLFFSSLEVEGLGAGNVKKIITAGFDTVPKILAMSEADFLRVDGFKQKMATKVKASIAERVEKATLAELMHATNLFGRGFGTKKFKSILTGVPTILTEQALPPAEKVKQVMTVAGMSKKTAEQFISQLPAFIAFLNETHLTEKIHNDNEASSSSAKDTSSSAKDTSHPLYKKHFVMTGFRDKILLEKLTAVGAEQDSTVRKNTFVVLVRDLTEETSKVGEAKALGIPIMTPVEFQDKYNL